MSHLSNNPLNLQHGEGNEHVYFSRITQQWEPVWFYATMLKKLNSFAQAIDRCATTSRELVWSHIFSLYNQSNRKCSDLFGPIIDEWCHSQAIDLSAIEIMYTSFLQMYNQYPGLFEDMLAPAAAAPSSSSPLSENHHSLSYSGAFSDSCSNNKNNNNNNNKGGAVDFKKEDPSSSASPSPSKQQQAIMTTIINNSKPIKLSNTSLLWGNSFPSSIQQFSLLLNWAPLLEKLPPNQKEAIWNTCQFFPLFTESFDRASFRKTFLKWASNLYPHLSSITILFAAIGFLRDKGIIKHQFFYPNTTVPVFNNGAKIQPGSQYYPPSSPHPHQHFSPSSPSSPSSSSPSSPSPSHAASPSATSSSRSPSPATSSAADFQPQPLHHFYPTLPTSISSHPVLPTIEGLRTPKPLPFDSLSLPPLSLPSAPLSASSTNQSIASSSSSRLGLLALAAFQADDTEAPQSASIPFPSLALPLPKKRENGIPASISTSTSTSTPTPTPTTSTSTSSSISTSTSASVYIPTSTVAIKCEDEASHEPRAPTRNPLLTTTTTPPLSPTLTPPNNSSHILMDTDVFTAAESQQQQLATVAATTLPPAAPISNDKAKPEPAMMKISKRKNSSCLDYHHVDDEAKRPRTMNLSHILCS